MQTEFVLVTWNEFNRSRPPLRYGMIVVRQQGLYQMGKVHSEHVLCHKYAYPEKVCLVPDDPKPLVTSQFPKKVNIQITRIRGPRKKSKRKHRLILLLKRVSFLKNTSSFSFFSSPSFRSLESGKNLDIC